MPDTGKSDMSKKRLPARLRSHLYYRFEPLKAWAIICYIEREFQHHMYPENLPFDTFDDEVDTITRDMNEQAWAEQLARKAGTSD